MWKWIQAFASPKIFYQTSEKIIPWLMMPFVVLSLLGLYWSFVVSPADYQQGDSVRIMYVHVPSAWMSLFIYVVMAVASGIGLIWQIKLAHIVANVSASIGASFTFLALATGSIWGKPMWGAWWAWDARLTSELILLFLYLAYISLNNAFDNPKTGDKACAVLAIVGLVNIPIIYYSVEWWNSLHQGSSISVTKVSMQIDMFIALMLISFAFKFLYGALMLLRARDEMLIREQNSRWVKEIIGE